LKKKPSKKTKFTGREKVVVGALRGGRKRVPGGHKNSYQ